MTEQTQKEIEEQLQRLQKGEREAIKSLDWQKISKEIGEKYLLDELSVESLQTEVGLVLVGLEYIGDFSDNVEENVNTSKDEAEKITEEITEKIFSPIAEIISEGIKNNVKNKDADWKQNLNFITSGGDYSVFEKNNNI